MSADAPDPDQVNALRMALPLVALAERSDADAFAVALGDIVAGPEDAARVLVGLVGLVRFTLGLPALEPGPLRTAVLDGMLLELAAADDTRPD